MAQSSIHSFFNTRKRPADDNLNKISKKVFLLDSDAVAAAKQTVDQAFITKATAPAARASSRIKQKLDFGPDDASSETMPQTPQQKAAKKVVSFTQMGPLSPKKRLRSRSDAPKTILKADSTPAATIVPNDLNVPNAPKKKKSINEMSLADIKEKLQLPKNARIVSESLKQFAELEKKRQELRKLNSLPITASSSKSTVVESPGKQLKPFSAIDLDIESPCKEFKTPEKVFKTPTPKKQQQEDQLMSPRQQTVRNPRRLLFSPSKGAEPSALPAYHKYKHLTTAPEQTLELPLKYRCLEELFKCCDTVCAIFFNRKERITFKKLKPAVERMSKRNFTEQHLAQIKHILPEAYEFHQHKMRNFGSVSKFDYYQLVVTPILDKTVTTTNEGNPIPEEEANLLNSQRLMDRSKKFHSRLFDMTATKHDEFLRGLQPPMEVERSKLRRWHPEFDIQSCAEVPRSELPLPPNVDKYHSAKDVLSTARNLFNCATPMERALARLEAKKSARLDQKVEAEVNSSVKTEATPAPEPPKEPISTMLKGVPESLLAKIREKQAAKALSVMTRRPSQEKEAVIYSRLPDLARHVRNVFVTEKKSCLATEMVLNKITNSFRTTLSQSELDNHLKMLAKVSEGWITYHEIQKVKYMKLSRQTDVAQMIEKLKKLADEKCA